MSSKFTRDVFPKNIPKDIVDIVKTYSYDREQTLKRNSSMILSELDNKYVNSDLLIDDLIKFLDRYFPRESNEEIKKVLNDKFYDILYDLASFKPVDPTMSSIVRNIIYLIYNDMFAYPFKQHHLITAAAAMILYIIGDDSQLVDLYVDGPWTVDFLDLDIVSWFASAIITYLGYIPQQNLNKDLRIANSQIKNYLGQDFAMGISRATSQRNAQTFKNKVLEGVKDNMIQDYNYTDDILTKRRLKDILVNHLNVDPKDL